MIDLFNSTYDVLLLIFGGIGITPLQSLYNHLIYQSSSNIRKFRKVIFIWSVKDRAMVDALYTDKLHSTIHLENQNTPYLPISFQPLMKPPPTFKKSHTTQKKVVPITNSILEIKNVNLEPEKGREEGERVEGESLNYQNCPIDLNSDLIFHNEYYLTKIRPDESQRHTAGIRPEMQTWLKFGRPNIKEIFERTAELCKKENISRVGVCVCGPPSMINDVVDVCNKSLSDPRCGQVRFDCHSEIFDF